MAENVYDGLFMLDSGRYSRDPGGVSDKITEIIKSFDGEILVSQLWEERRLAYPIRGHRKGTYWLSYFRIDGSKIAGIERQCQLTDSILRVMFVKVDPRIVDALVEHAKAGHSSKSSNVSKHDEGRKGKTVDEDKKGKTVDEDKKDKTVDEDKKDKKVNEEETVSDKAQVSDKNQESDKPQEQEQSAAAEVETDITSNG